MTYRKKENSSNNPSVPSDHPKIFNNTQIVSVSPHKLIPSYSVLKTPSVTIRSPSKILYSSNLYTTYTTQQNNDSTSQESNITTSTAHSTLNSGTKNDLVSIQIKIHYILT